MTQATQQQLRELAASCKAWPFDEARKVAKRLARGRAGTKRALFETGYGPSGLPHIGTFAEVARTTMVQRAYELFTGSPTRLIAFSDDMDGLRKVPDNVPEQEMLARHLGKPLTAVPDPFGTHASFGEHNNARLQVFLDAFGFDYEFVSSTECYKGGRFDDALRRVLECFDEIRNIILPTLGEERRKTYSPILPLCPRTGVVLQVPIEPRPGDGTVVFKDDAGKSIEVPVTGGHCKLQWKADWAMRWHALGVDYEMSGKDLMESVQLSGKICRVLGSQPPEGFSYELFLDEKGEKISKSKGNGLAVEEWLQYSTRESLAYYLYQAPRRAKKLYLDVIPKNTDDYLRQLSAFPEQEPEKQLANPVWHVHAGDPPQEDVPISYAMLLNLVSAAHTEDKRTLWGFITRYADGATQEDHPYLDRLLDHAVHYYKDFVEPHKRYRAATDLERAAIEDLIGVLEGMPEGAEGEVYQTEVYAVGKRHDFAELRDWFRGIYEVTFGQSAGPRFGSFIALFGVAETIELLRSALNGELLR